MDLIQTKVLVAVLFGLIRYIFGILPLKIFSWLKIEKTVNGVKVLDESIQVMVEHGVALLQSFGGGVLFATCFLHMMPEVYYSVEELKRFGVLEPKYPYSQLIVSTGFFIVYFIEEISQWIVTKVPKVPYKKKTKKKKKLKSRTDSATTISTILSQGNRVGPEFIHDDHMIYTEFEEKKEKNNTDFEDEFSVDVNEDDNKNNNENNENNEDKEKADSEDMKDDPTVEIEVKEEQELEQIMEQDSITQQQFLRCVFIVLALSFHATLEGLAIGLQHSIANIWYMFIAVSIHAVTIQFCIGLEIYLSGSKPRVILANMMILSSGSPTGVLIGLAISLTTDMDTKGKSLAVVLLEGLSAGTILYITFFEVLSREKARRMCRIKRAACIGAGFALMAGLECLKIE